MRAFVAAYTATAILVRAGRYIVERFASNSIVQRKLNEAEARFGIPQYKDLLYGIYEVRNSSWITEVVRLNRYSFPKTTDEYVRKHFLLAFHDDTFECLADDLTLEVVNEPYEVTFARIRQRAFGDGVG